MSHREARVAKGRLLGAGVTIMEAAVLIDMAQAVQAGSTIYSWGHDRLALVILKPPGSIAAKRALTGRIIPALISKGLVTKLAGAHRGRRAEYDLTFLHDDWEPGMGTAQTGTHSEPGKGTGMGTGLSMEWVPVSKGMGTGLSGTPATHTATNTPNSAARADSDAHASATREEVRSSSSKSKTTARKQQWISFPEGFAPNGTHIDRARKKGLDLDDEFTRFRDHSLATGKRSPDWDACLLDWLNRARPERPRSRSTGKGAGELMQEVYSIRLPGEEGYTGESVA